MADTQSTIQSTMQSYAQQIAVLESEHETLTKEGQEAERKLALSKNYESNKIKRQHNERVKSNTEQALQCREAELEGVNASLMNPDIGEKSKKENEDLKKSIEAIMKEQKLKIERTTAEIEKYHQSPSGLPSIPELISEIARKGRRMVEIDRLLADLRHKQTLEAIEKGNQIASTKQQ